MILVAYKKNKSGHSVERVLMSVSVTEKGDLLEFVTNNCKQKTVTF